MILRNALLLPLTILLACGISAFGSTWIVDNSGSGDFTTIQAAIADPAFVDPFDDPDTIDTGMGYAPILDMGAYEFGISECSCDNGLAGDLNCDGIVNSLDMALMAAHWLETL